jgi:hypothetical protein
MEHILEWNIHLHIVKFKKLKIYFHISIIVLCLKLKFGSVISHVLCQKKKKKKKSLYIPF